MILSDIGQENNLKNEKMLQKMDKMRKPGSTAMKRKYTRKIKILENIPLEESESFTSVTDSNSATFDSRMRLPSYLQLLQNKIFILDT